MAFWPSEDWTVFHLPITLLRIFRFIKWFLNVLSTRNMSQNITRMFVYSRIHFWQHLFIISPGFIKVRAVERHVRRETVTFGRVCEVSRNLEEMNPPTLIKIRFMIPCSLFWHSSQNKLLIPLSQFSSIFHECSEHHTPTNSYFIDIYFTCIVWALRARNHISADSRNFRCDWQ